MSRVARQMDDGALFLGPHSGPSMALTGNWTIKI